MTNPQEQFTEDCRAAGVLGEAALAAR